MSPQERMQHRFYPESLFGEFTDSDGTMAFYLRVQALASGRKVIDFGCGRGQASEDAVPIRREMRCLRRTAKHVLGLDVDVGSGMANPLLDEFLPLDSNDCGWPVPDGSYGLVISDCVLEHLPDPAAFFREAYRSLHQGGFLAIRSPNILSYVGLTARLVPNSMHGRLLSRAQSARKQEDIFPTFYRCNTVRSIRRAIKTAGFREQAVYGHESEPQYLAFSRIAYRLGVWHQKLAPSWIAPAIFAFARK